MSPKIISQFIISLIVGALLFFANSVESSAQFLPSTSTVTSESAETDFQSLVDTANKKGVTIVVIEPESKTGPKVDEDDSMGAENFLKARKRLAEIVSSAPTLWTNIKATVQNASPDGGTFWIYRSVATALVGLFLGWLINRPLSRWVREHFRFMYNPEPKTTADKAQYLLFRALLALVYVVVFFFAAMAVAVVFDPVIEPGRRIVFEIVAGYAAYRVLRYGVAWNLSAHDVPTHRLLNLNDDQAWSFYRDWYWIVALGATNVAVSRFLNFTAEDQRAAGLTNTLTPENVGLIQIISAAFVVLLLILYTIKNWKACAQALVPHSPHAWMVRARTTLARLAPLLGIIYGIGALITFLFKLALDQPAPGLVIAAPFLISYAALVVYGIVIIVIQALYNRRTRRFEELAAAEIAKQEAEQELVDAEAGEEMVRSPDPVQFEYQPMFRGFFEGSALAIILAVSIGELGRIWGIDVAARNNLLASSIDILLATALCWLGYDAVTRWINKRIEEEGGVPEGGEAEELGGEGGGAGATRMATLLPIFRYVVVIILFSIAVMIILSELGFDIGPIFAGAGVVGIAVGFGAQTLIRDIFSGAFFLLDDAFRKGEYVEIEGIKGTVEKISIRSFQLRHHLGALHTIPFGEIKQLTNYSRDWVMMKLPLRVTYDTDVEKVRKLVKKLGQSLLEHPQVGHTFMQPLKSQGVYKMEDSAMIIRVKFMTKPGEQFVTRKVVYESIQDLFAREGIKFAHKEVTVRLADEKDPDELTEEEKKAVTSAARSVIDAEEEARLAAAGAGKSDSDR